MIKTRVFVSSTCFDLGEIRRHLEDFIESSGYEPVMSDSKSLPIPPGLTPIETCKWLVRSSHIFVLIIGGRFGSTAGGTAKSITNIEFDTALDAGMPIYAFVDNRVFSKRETHSRLKGMAQAGDISPEKVKQILGQPIEDERVFDFIEYVTSVKGGLWVFSFDDAASIVSTLKSNWSFLFADLLSLRQKPTQIYTSEMRPELSVHWAVGEDSDRQYAQQETIDVYPKLPITKDLFIRNLIDIKVKSDDIECMKGSLSQISSLARQQNAHVLKIIGNVEAPEIISSIEKYNRRIDELIALADTNFEEFFSKAFPQMSRIPARVYIFNGGTCPAENIIAYIYPKPSVTFAWSKDTDDKHLVIPDEGPAWIGKVIQLAKDVSQDKPIPQETLPVLRPLQATTVLSSWNYGIAQANWPDAQSFWPQLSYARNAPISVSMNIEDDNLRIDIEGKLKHGFMKLIENTDISILCRLNEGQEELLDYSIHADNIPEPQKGQLKIVGSREQ